MSMADTSRRITHQTHVMTDDRSMLKNVAGLIQKLSYREMRELSGLLDAGASADVAENLLAAADKILGTTNGH